MAKKKPKGYLSNKELLEELLDCQEKGVVSDKLGISIMLLVDRYSRKPNFSGYSYLSEMQGAAILKCVASYQKFDVTRSEIPNAFAYFTTIVHNEFLQFLKKEKTQQKIRDKILMDNNLDPSRSFLDQDKTE